LTSSSGPDYADLTNPETGINLVRRIRHRHNPDVGVMGFMPTSA
jgi:hypothetical protein